jgi:parallel beta-helix repeat protein
MNRNTRIVTLSLALVFAATEGAAIAGDLDPPAGPISPTMKPLSEVEPRVAINATNTPGDADSLFKITQPGSYYLTGNIVGVSGKHGIEIASSNVSVDLMGFALLGVTGSLDGITTEGTRNDVIIRRGTISGWGSDGINLTTGGFGSNYLVELITSSSNGAEGLSLGSNGVVQGCAAQSNGGSGIHTSEGGTVTNCSAASNTGNGISTGNGSTVTYCTVKGNGSFGIATATSGTITNCAAYLNTLDGIHVPNACLVQGNTCDSNGNGGDGAGIHATNADNRIEGNNCTRSDRGIDVDSAGNIILKNTCSGNTTNYDIAADNRYGAIVNITASGTAAVAGNSAASTLTTTDPWANFAY